MQHIYNTTTSVIGRRFVYWRKLFSFIRDQNKWGGSQSAVHLRYWRRLIFVVGAIINHKLMEQLLVFFGSNFLRLSIVTAHPSILEQTTRQWLYNQSIMQERVTLVMSHFLFLQTHLSEVAMQQLYLSDGIVLWNQQYQEDTLLLKLHYNRNCRKEGLMAIALNLGIKRIYSASIWVVPNTDGKMALWIGCLQGSKGESKTIHDLTKHFFGYRPKNFMFHAVRTVARLLQLDIIYAVSNYGSYVNHRFRSNRRLKTSLDVFWEELGGQISNDPRFFTLAGFEFRKSLQEVATHKRNLYRKRFAALDAICAEITKALGPHLLKL